MNYYSVGQAIKSLKAATLQPLQILSGILTKDEKTVAKLKLLLLICTGVCLCVWGGWVSACVHTRGCQCT